ncbi:MAG: dienelactone hydrolase family protein [Phycisphaeraceae bacterium]|nr:dienelactone hydrolase family protein [Phycisphaeraceae bacterium]
MFSRPVLATLLLCLLAPFAARADVVMDTIDYQHGDVALRGYLFYDNADEHPRPGVMVVHEWWGNNSYARSRARQLAEMGYAAFAADMYGMDKTTEDPEQAKAWASAFYQDQRLLRDRAEAGLDILRKLPLCKDQPLAAIGFCFGGSTVLQLACDNPDRLAAVVSFHGNPAPPEEKDPEHIQPAILICHGADDPFVSPESLQAAIDGFRQHNADLTLIEYEGAKHSFTNPEADGSFNEGAIYHEEAAKKAWADMQEMFERVLKPQAETSHEP